MRCTARSVFVVVAAGLATVALVLPVRSPAQEDDASFTSQSVPGSMGTGSRTVVSLTFRNTGSTSWTASGGYLLASPDPVTAANWEVSMIALPSAVAAGSSVTFSFSITAPGTPGTYSFQWQMQKQTRFFGASSANVPVKVIAPSSG